MKQIDIYSIAQTLQQHHLFAFTSHTVGDLFGMDRVKVSHLLKRMEQKGLVARVEAGKYVLLGLSPDFVLSNPLYIGCSLASPAYVSFWSALHFYGFTEQVPRRVYLATTRRKKPANFKGAAYQFVTLRPEAFWGYQRRMLAGLPVLVADEARAILDSLLYPQYAGGISETAKALRNALDQEESVVETTTLIDYANRLGSLSLGSRLGYLLELLGKPTQGLIGSRGPVSLESGRSRVGQYDARWRIYINLAQKELFPEGVA